MARRGPDQCRGCGAAVDAGGGQAVRGQPVVHRAAAWRGYGCRARRLGRRTGSDRRLHRLGRLGGQRLPGGVAVHCRHAGAGAEYPARCDAVRQRDPVSGDRGQAARRRQWHHRRHRSAPPLRQPARQRGRRGRGAVVLDESVHRRHHGRAGRGGDVFGAARALSGLEGPVPVHHRRGGRIPEQARRCRHQAGVAHGGDAGPGASARHRAALHAVHGGRLGPHGQGRGPLPAVPWRAQGVAGG